MTQALWDKYLINCGFPENILIHHGHKFESKQKTELCSLTCTEKYVMPITDHRQIVSVRFLTLL